MKTGIYSSPGAAKFLSVSALCPLPSLPSAPPQDHHLLGVHSQHHAQRGVTTSGEVVPVAAHADGVQPVPHGEAPTAIPAPAEIKAALGKGRGRAPEAQGPLVRGMSGPSPSSRTLALATLSLPVGSAVGKRGEIPGLEGED